MTLFTLGGYIMQHNYVATDTNGGAAYVFTATGTGWHQSAELQGSISLPDDGFCASVAISGALLS